MSEPFLSEIKMVGFNFPPRGWATCDGQILPINQNQSLYSLLGTTYGGDGRTSFALPDMRGRAPTHFGAELRQGNRGGEETHTLQVAELPEHNHALTASFDQSTSTDPTGNVFATKARRGADIYGPPNNLTSLSPETVTSSGNSEPHENMQPYLVVNFVIALQGIFPSRN